MNLGVYLLPKEFTTEAYTEMLQIPGLKSSIWIAFAEDDIWYTFNMFLL